MDSSTSTVAAQAQTVEESVTTTPKPVYQPYYKSPNQIDASLIIFEKKADRAVSGPIRTTTFSVGMRSTEVTATPPPAVAAAAAGGRGGRAGGRGGRGGRGTPVVKPAALAIKPVTSLRTKYGISIGQSAVTGVTKDTSVIDRLKENPHLINRIAAGMDDMPPGVHFEILFFLDPAEPEHQRLEQLSNECREAFEEFTYSLPHGVVSDKLSTNGFVRVSEKTDERYIVLTMSTMHTVEGKRFYPTPFYTRTDETVLWDALVQYSFRAEVEFRVSHVMLVGNDKASFKSYVSSCKLVEVPKRAVSDARQAQEAYVQKIKDSVRRAVATTPEEPSRRAATEVDAEDVEDQMAALVSKASEVITEPPAEVVPAPAPTVSSRVRKSKTEGSAPKVVKVKVAPPPEEDDEEERVTTPVPSGIIKNLSTRKTA